MLNFFKKKPTTSDLLQQMAQDLVQEDIRRAQEEKEAKERAKAEEMAKADTYFSFSEDENLAITYAVWKDEYHEITAELLEEIFNFILKESSLNVQVVPSIYKETMRNGEVVDRPAVMLVNGDDDRYWKLEVAVIGVTVEGQDFTGFYPEWYGNPDEDANYEERYSYYVEIADYYRRACDIVSQRY